MLVESLFDVPFLWCSNFLLKNRNDLDSQISSRNFVFTILDDPPRSCLLIRNFGFKEKIKVVRTGGFTVHPFSGPETEIFSRKKFKNDFRTRRINWTVAKMNPLDDPKWPASNGRYQSSRWFFHGRTLVKFWMAPLAGFSPNSEIIGKFRKIKVSNNLGISSESSHCNDFR